MGGNLLSKKSSKKGEKVPEVTGTRKYAAYLTYGEGEYDYVEPSSEEKVSGISLRCADPGATAICDYLTEEILRHIITCYLPLLRQRLVLRLVSRAFNRMCSSPITTGLVHLGHLPVVYQGAWLNVTELVSTSALAC